MCDGRFVAGTILAVVLSIGQQAAAQTMVVYLSCDGTTRIVADKTGVLEPVKNMGLVVNLAERTVSGFALPAHIDSADAASIKFSNQNSPYLGGTYSVTGSIDRVTGVAWATTMLTAHDQKVTTNDRYDLVCTVTNRLF